MIRFIYIYNIKFKYIEKWARLQLFSPRCAKPARKLPSVITASPPAARCCVA